MLRQFQGDPLFDPPGGVTCATMPSGDSPRHFAPSGPVTHYRLRVPLPSMVDFPSVSYALHLQSTLAAGRHELMAHDAAGGGWWSIGPAYLARESLERAVYEAGVAVRRDTVGAVIMRRLVLEGRAERVPMPVVDLATLRPSATSHLGEWYNATR
jgi:hypothetical protein